MRPQAEGVHVRNGCRIEPALTQARECRQVPAVEAPELRQLVEVERVDVRPLATVEQVFEARRRATRVQRSRHHMVRAGRHVA